MADARDVAVLVGSLRKESWTRKLTLAAIALAPPRLQFRIVEIAALPLYNADLETEAPPAPWRTFREELGKAHAVLFATPEYNRSVPGVLKNAIDVASRPPAQKVLQGKPAAVLSVSPGAMGAFGANHHLRQSLVFLDMPTMQQPEAYIAKVADVLDENGALKVPATREFLAKFMEAFADWIDRHAR